MSFLQIEGHSYTAITYRLERNQDAVSVLPSLRCHCQAVQVKSTYSLNKYCQSGKKIEDSASSDAQTHKLSQAAD